MAAMPQRVLLPAVFIAYEEEATQVTGTSEHAQRVNAWRQQSARRRTPSTFQGVWVRGKTRHHDKKKAAPAATQLHAKSNWTTGNVCL